jgi:hypothetical protein
VSGTCVPDTCRTTQLPRRCSSFFDADMCAIAWMLRSPMQMSASPASSGASSSGMSPPAYWLSASVLTM